MKTYLTILFTFFLTACVESDKEKASILQAEINALEKQKADSMEYYEVRIRDAKRGISVSEAQDNHERALSLKHHILDIKEEQNASLFLNSIDERIDSLKTQFTKLETTK